MDQFEKELSIMELDKLKTINEKKKLINEIRNGLGEEIKKTRGKIEIKKKSKFTKIMESIFKLF
jgi:hypothetical protein